MQVLYMDVVHINAKGLLRDGGLLSFQDLEGGRDITAWEIGPAVSGPQGGRLNQPYGEQPTENWGRKTL